jgi:hypothetical protein
MKWVKQERHGAPETTSFKLIPPESKTTLLFQFDLVSPLNLIAFSRNKENSLISRGAC